MSADIFQQGYTMACYTDTIMTTQQTNGYFVVELPENFSFVELFLGPDETEESPAEFVSCMVIVDPPEGNPTADIVMNQDGFIVQGPASVLKGGDSKIFRSVGQEKTKIFVGMSPAVHCVFGVVGYN